MRIQTMMKKPFSLFLLWILVGFSSYGQAPTQAYLDYMNGLESYVQNDLYGKVAAVLYDVDDLPPAGDYIDFVTQIKKELEEYYQKNSVGLKEEEKKNARIFTNTMLVQLGDLYFDRGQELDTSEKLLFLERFFGETGLESSISELSDDLARSLMMTVHTALGIPFGMPNEQVGAFVQELEEPKKEMFLAALIQNDMLMLSGGYDVSKFQIEGFKSTYPQSVYIDNLDNGLLSIEKLRAGAQVENFSFVDLEGNQVSLTDFKDKIIYLDLWASWCGPCINTFRTKTPEFESKLREKEDVVLMYISIDEKEEPWRNYLSKNPMRGVHLFAGKGFQAEIMQYFKVWGIPRYLIIGKDNKIIDVNAPRPGDEAFEVLSKIQ
ncbi:Thioredoxin-like [Aquiflexum balticum DSM 16537]|uniref:Thioredoxin-like n=1 Tax=Aquiflexum balticum DSM 16537 TaxID=758820 RepID=A0A1W2H062_9BACT|nr:TlpA disulfide reductase family protein [Aquiflexum balticum]SMD42018.1 Thioredoxin-like [Aquiflexum balticum DSM 16537]